MHVELNEANARRIQRICSTAGISVGAFANHILDVVLTTYDPATIRTAIIISIEKMINTAPPKN